MDDLTITRLCAEAMGLEIFTDAYGETVLEQPDHDLDNVAYDPLHDDAQAMALVKKFKLNALWGGRPDKQKWAVWQSDESELEDGVSFYSADLNRAICECVARMQKEKGNG